jgi:diadenylate cyclase
MSPISLFHNAPRLQLRDFFDIGLVTYITYLIARLIRGTRAWSVLMGILAFSATLWLAHHLGLRALSFLLDRAAMIGPVALLVVFLPEVRQWVMEMGTGSFWRGPFTSGAPEILGVVDEIISAVEQLAQSRMGALIVIEGRVGLDDICETGRRLDSLVSSELVLSLFYPGSALHDGAAVIREKRIVAAGCVLPLPAERDRTGGRTAHTRHTAALELAQQTDALVVVVSEETGSISLASNRSLIRGLTTRQLRERLVERLGLPASRFHLLRRSP